jgi:hypothetical protein
MLRLWTLVACCVVAAAAGTSAQVTADNLTVTYVASGVTKVGSSPTYPHATIL